MLIQIPASELFMLRSAPAVNGMTPICDTVLDWCEEHQPQIEYYSEVCVGVVSEIIRYLGGKCETSEQYPCLELEIEHAKVSAAAAPFMNSFDEIQRTHLLHHMAESGFVFNIDTAVRYANRFESN